MCNFTVTSHHSKDLVSTQHFYSPIWVFVHLHEKWYSIFLYSLLYTISYSLPYTILYRALIMKLPELPFHRYKTSDTIYVWKSRIFRCCKMLDNIHWSKYSFVLSKFEIWLKLNIMFKKNNVAPMSGNGKDVAAYVKAIFVTVVHIHSWVC